MLRKLGTEFCLKVHHLLPTPHPNWSRCSATLFAELINMFRYSTPVDDRARLAAAVESIGQAYLTAHRDFLDVARTALDEITEAD